ncbi:MAG: PTS lactose/cellobiose transporter subunit IIA [Fusobacteriaceae bacterium]
MSNEIMEMDEQLEEIVFSIVGFAGECRGLAFEALGLSENGKIMEAEAMLKEAEKALHQAHYVQTDLIQKEAAGEKMPISMVFVHAQDHLMTAISEKELIKKLVKTNAKLDELTKRLERLEQK